MCRVCGKRVWPWDLLFWFRWKWDNHAPFHARCVATLDKRTWCELAGIKP